MSFLAGNVKSSLTTLYVHMHMYHMYMYICHSLTLSASQRGLQYLVCHSVRPLVCLSVCLFVTNLVPKSFPICLLMRTNEHNIIGKGLGTRLVCYHVFCHYVQQGGQKAIPTGSVPHWPNLKMAIFVNVLRSKVMV